MADDYKQPDPNDINYTTNTYDSSNDNEDNSNEEVEENKEPLVEVKEEFIKPKKNILHKILFGIVAFLLLLLIIGTILYFTGFFDPEEVKKVEAPVVAQNVEKVEAPENNYKFDIKDINSKKLNEQLASLTSKNLNDEKIEELEKKENEKRLIDEQKRKEDELLKKQEDELTNQKTQLEQKKLELEREKIQLETMKQQSLQLKEELHLNQNKSTETTSNLDSEKQKVIETINSITPKKALEEKELVNNQENTKKDNGFLLFINVAKIKDVLYKKYLDKIVAVSPNIKLCRDDKNRIEIYYGPFDNNEERTELLNKLFENKFNEAYELEFTQEEFDKRFNY